jgi:uncharacterized membrane protein YcfT
LAGWREFLTWIEGSALGQVVRDTGVWTYGLINLVHILGIATLFGSILVLDLRLLGWRRRLSLTAVADATVPISIAGFVVAICSGLCLLATNGSEYIGNPFLPIKFGAIAVGVINAVIVSRLSAWRLRGDRESSTESLALKACGGISLAAWVGAVGAGRMIGYW